MIVHRSALVDRPATLMFDLIEAAEDYPRFLPWCASATIVQRDDALVSADIRVRYGGVNFELRTRNPKRRPEYMAIHLERGPFRRFEGEWHVTPLSATDCKVAFALDYHFDSAMVTRVAGPVFDRIANTMVDAFVRQAQTLPLGPCLPSSP
jgi:ribosome-associated toxin RatA of RatAB toxin-antitoxin module